MRGSSTGRRRTLAAAGVRRHSPLILLNSSAGPVPAPCASRTMVPSSMFQSTSASTLQFARGIEALHPAAEIAERNGLSFYRHGFSRSGHVASFFAAGIGVVKSRGNLHPPPR